MYNAVHKYCYLIYVVVYMWSVSVQVSVTLLTCMAKACSSSLAKISSSVLPGVFRLVHSPLLQGAALAAILDFLQALVLSKTSNLGFRFVRCVLDLFLAQMSPQQ